MTPSPPQVWVSVGAPKHFSEGRGRVCQVGDLKVAVFRKDNAFYAILNRCPHAAASLGLGQLKGLLVTCPRHQWQFNVATGACFTSPDFCVQTFPVRVVRGVVEVGLPDPPQNSEPPATSS